MEQQPASVHESSASALESESDPSTTGDADSGLGSESDRRSIRTQSVTSSVYEYKWENDRRYHAYQEGQYLMPNDENEQDRLDLQHHLFRLTADGKLYIAPVPTDVQSCLDIGCGTGIWAVEFADEHPAASVLGTDLSPIQPDSVPPNCSFRVDDAENEWIPGETFDFIHSRAMLAGFRNWPRFLRQSFEHLNPGGYIELQDLCFPARVQSARNGNGNGNGNGGTGGGSRAQAQVPVAPEMEPETETEKESEGEGKGEAEGANANPAGSHLVRWCLHCIEAGRQTGLNLEAPINFTSWLREAGFVDIHVKWHNWPLGLWAKGQKNKDIGRWALANFLDGLPAANALFTRVLGWSYEEVQVFVAECKTELIEQRMHVYLPVCFAYARKPREGEVVGMGS